MFNLQGRNHEIWYGNYRQLRIILWWKEGSHIFIDSFDNENFEVRVGSLEDSKPVGNVVAFTDVELNSKLLELYNKHIGGA